MFRSFSSITSALVLAVLMLHAQTPETGSLTLTLLDSRTQRPIPNASVEIATAGSGGRIVQHKATSDSKGKAEFKELPPAVYSVSQAKARGYQFYNFLASSLERHQVTENGAINATLLVNALGLLEGKVSDEAGDPVQGVQIVLLHDQVKAGIRFLTTAKQTTTDDRGLYRLPELTPGYYTLRAGAGLRNDLKIAPTYYPSASGPNQALRIHVTPGGTLPSIDFHLRAVDTFHLRGSITGLAPSSQGSRVIVESCPFDRREDPAIRVTAVTRRGSFDVQGLPPGNYCVTAEERPGPPGVGVLKTVAFTDVTIKDEDVQNIRLAVLPPKRIKITTTADQAYLGNGYLQLTPMRGPLQLGNALTPKIDPATRTVQVDGLLPIPYRLEDSVCSSTLFCYIQSMKQEGSDVAGGIIDGAVGGAVSFHIGYTETSLRTTIDLGSRKPVEGMRVTIAPEGVTAKQNDTITTRYTDADGEILWTLLPGDYKVYAWEQYHHELAKSSEFLRQFQGTSVTVKKDGQSPVKVRLITANEVEGVLASFK